MQQFCHSGSSEASDRGTYKNIFDVMMFWRIGQFGR